MVDPKSKRRFVSRRMLIGWHPVVVIGRSPAAKAAKPFKCLLVALASLLMVLVAAGCGAGGENGGAGGADRPGSGGGGAEAGQPIRVVATIAQIAEPISVIGGDRVEVQSLMGPGVDPHLYTPTHGDIVRLEKADIIFYNGLHLEANMLRAFEEIGKTRPVLAVAEAIEEDRLLRDETGAVDPHVWFDLHLWKDALAAAVEKLKELSPEDAEWFEENKRAYFREMDALLEEAKKLMGSIPEQNKYLVTAHDAFGYFGRLHGLKVVGLQGLSTEDEIGLTDIEDTIAILLEYRVPAVFVESSVNPDAILAVIEGAKSKGLHVKLGGELFSDAMGAAGTEEGTYLGMYRHNVKVIHEALLGTGHEAGE